MTGSRAGAPGLVPLADRFRYLQYLRFAMVVPILVTLAYDRGQATMPLNVAAIVCGVYLVLTLPTVRSWRLPRSSAITVFGATLLIDGVFLAALTYGSGGLNTSLRYLILLQVVSVTLCASFRTGLKIALWTSLLLGATYQMQQARVIHTITPPKMTDLVADIGAVLLVTLATASFGAVNERELRRRNYDLRALSEFAIALESVSNAQDVAKALVEAVIDGADCDRIIVSAAPTGELVGLAARGVAPVRADLHPGDDALIAEAMRTRSTVRVRATDPALDPWLSATMPDAHNLVIMPLYSEAGPMGVLVFENKARGSARIERRIIEVVEQFVSQTALSLQNAWLLEQVRGLAATDALTGISNRRTFDSELLRELSRADRSGSPLALILVDIDHFKLLNDSFGHQEGDAALQRVAAALRAEARTTDTVARYGGEEFVILLPGSEPGAAHGKADRFRSLLESLPQKPGVTASFGVAVYPHHATDGPSLIAAADAALYESKNTGRNKVTLAWQAVAASNGTA